MIRRIAIALLAYFISLYVFKSLGVTGDLAMIRSLFVTIGLLIVLR